MKWGIYSIISLPIIINYYPEIMVNNSIVNIIKIVIKGLFKKMFKAFKEKKI